jgi:DNA-binding NarL/FixJ family response regulator
MIRVLIIDDEREVIEWIEVLISSRDDMKVVGSLQSGHGAISYIEALRPDVVLMDISMPGISGVETTKQIKDHFVGAPEIVILTTFALNQMVLSALHAGAQGFILKSDPPQDLYNAIITAHRGDSLISPKMLRNLITGLTAKQPQKLHVEVLRSKCSSRELDVLKLVVRGLTNADIASLLYISENTVRSHVAHLRDKLNVKSRAALVAKGWELVE